MNFYFQKGIQEKLSVAFLDFLICQWQPCLTVSLYPNHNRHIIITKIDNFIDMTSDLKFTIFCVIYFSEKMQANLDS
jgi:hypothetical protein